MRGQQIRDFTLDLLKRSGKFHGVRFYNFEVVAIQDDFDLPAISVSTPNETWELDTPQDFGVAGNRSETLVITIIVRADSKIDPVEENWVNLLDKYEKKVIDTLLGNTAWLSQYDTVAMVETEREVTNDAQQPMAMVSITISSTSYEVMDLQE